MFLLLLLVLVGIPVQAQDEKAESPTRPLMLGIDALEGLKFAPLIGKQVGLITNRTGVDSQGRSTADILAQAPGVKLVALFSPEHGIRSVVEAGQSIDNMIDPDTHLPIYSLYGTTQKPTQEMLNAVDVLVFDIQDVGARFYTYLTTMGMAMEAAADRGIEFMVLDRPNPVGGSVLEGQVLDSRIRHFTAYYSVPIRHGFTAGELAQWYNRTARLGARLKVVRMVGWRRPERWGETGLHFVPPSPNIRTPMEELLYSGLGCFEATNVSVGRGTRHPFELIGAPWIDGERLEGRLNALSLPGVEFRKAHFRPRRELYAGKRCSGVRILVTDSDRIRPVDIFVHAAFVLRELYPLLFQPRWNEMARVTGSYDFEHLYKAGLPVSTVLGVFHKSAAQFEKDREKYLLY